MARSFVRTTTNFHCLCALLCLTLSPALAQSPDYQPLAIDSGSAALQQSLRKLNTRASLMMIVAHPDDEDGGMLAYESRGQGAQVTLLTLNRGEGGQNIMSNDLWDQLALVRTQELLAADRYYGVDQYFTRVADFGFSKTLEEAMTVWNHDRVLYDVVRAVRINRPLVLASVFVGGITDGHGQHQVSGEITQEVFTAAGDPNVFPEQIKAGLLPWTPLKVYARVPDFSISPKGMYDYATGKWSPVRFYDYVSKQWTNAVPTTNVKIPEGTWDPVLGRSYIQLGRMGLGQQKSQNGGMGIPLPGKYDSAYHRYGSRVAPAANHTAMEHGYFDGVDTRITGIATLAQHPPAFLTTGLAHLSGTIAQATRTYTPSHPEKLAPLLSQVMQQTQALIDQVQNQVQSSTLTAEEKVNVEHELQVKLGQANDALIQALGVTLTAVVAGPKTDRGPFAVDAADSFTSAIPGQSFNVTVYVANPGPLTLQLKSVNLQPNPAGDWHIAAVTPPPAILAPGERQAIDFKVTVPAGAPVTRACFHRPSLSQPYYDLDSEACLDRPLPPYPLQANLEVSLNGVTAHAAQVVQSVQHMVGTGGVYRPLVLVPALSVATTATAGIIPLDGSQKYATVTVRVRSNLPAPTEAEKAEKSEKTAELHLNLPPGWQADPATLPLAAQSAGEQMLAFHVTPQSLSAAAYPIVPVATLQGHDYTQGYETVGYTGLRPYNYYPVAPYKLVGIDVKVAKGINVGYVMGTGDDVPQALESLGVSVHLLPPAEIAADKLAAYDVIVLGIRAYAARPELVAANSRLLAYVKQGGVLIVQYNSREFDHNYGPYPLALTGDPEKVVDETDPVKLLDPSSPLLSWPNAITPADFDGWVEERGHSFMHTWDNHYDALTETHDPGQSDQKGGLLATRYGKGTWVYVAYALYRQLPEGVPGAYRLFANLLSLPKYKPATP